MTAPLPMMLRELRLSAFGQHYEAYQEQATEQAWGYSKFLSRLCENEIARRFETRNRNWTKEAKLPRGKSFSTLTLDELPNTIQKKVIGLRDNTQWALQADNVLLIGPSGVGKSHIASALGLHLIEQGIRVKWLPATSLVQLLSFG